MSKDYFRPIPTFDDALSRTGHILAGGWCRFSQVEVLSRDSKPRLIDADDLPDEVRTRLTAPRKAMAGLHFDAPKIMAILNVTPDSFSDGGTHETPARAVAHGRRLVEAGADMLDIGGESTRPGAITVPAEVEISRVQPVISALRTSLSVPISIDTRKARVARKAIEAGADMVNDVSAMSFDPSLGKLVSDTNVPICLMHMQGDPETMHLAPSYKDVVLDVYDQLEASIVSAEALGVARSRIMVDVGIGFGKTLEHNLDLLRRLSLFHGLGCPILLGASRKRFIGTLSNTPVAAMRMPGSIAAAMVAVSQGIQVIRVHDMAETRQALSIHMAIGPRGAAEPR